MDELAAKRADKAQDSHLWTPKDALEFALKQVTKTDVTQLMVHWLRKNEDGTFTHKYSVAGMNRAEVVAFLEMFKADALAEWKIGD
jgi:hypothetical protein